MKLWTRIAMLSTLALSLAACTQAPPGESDEIVGDDDVASDEGSLDNRLINDTNEDVGEAEQAVTCQWNLIMHYTYSDGTGNYKWDVSFNYSTGKIYVDERRIGGGFYKQYALTPQWKECFDPATYVTETVNLKNSGVTLSGPHNCLPDTREEVHLQDKQRVLSKAPGFYEWVCNPI